MVDALAAKKAGGGKSTLKAEQHTSLGLFKEAELVKGRVKINQSQFHQSTIDNLTKRMPESGIPNMLKPLDKPFWPAMH